nr:immunoglobulin heavy chain junction region [Macaca mulatta]MOV50533.1 immunoglobulin heavy chain junction region [Macaca mulatta]MOV50740.1 immunoglobulin heavy chain junction region [Macaca mulatta]MOV51613.1 immunoglobulin heavy chain junction region [Macaca mulatta]MOV51990.1 immunoglobulin heavy chain junction region [Macaca mulatta]
CARDGWGDYGYSYILLNYW